MKKITSKEFIERELFRIREGSIADYARVIGVGALLWGALFALAVQSYPM